jgi:hypothetical protein
MCGVTTHLGDSMSKTPIQPGAAPMLIAERAAAAFISAVNEVLGPEHAYEAAEFWIEQLNVVDWASSDRPPNWRRITIEAAARIASNCQRGPSEARKTSS